MVVEALRTYLNEVTIKTLPYVEIKIVESVGRTLAEDIKAKIDVPHFDRAAMDGYAVKADDTFGASPTNPNYC